MYKIENVDYKGQALRLTNIDSKRWWSFSDVCSKVLKFVQFGRYLKKLNDCDKRKIAVVHKNKHGGVKMNFVNEAGLARLLNIVGRLEADEFKDWLVEKYSVNFPEAEVTEDYKSPRSSAQVSLQKAQMLIRIAEHKAVPLDEQLRLLSLASKELTGAGFSTVSIPHVEDNSDIMKLPEVIGYIKDKRVKDIDSCKVTFYPVTLFIKRVHFDSIEEFNLCANKYKFKTNHHGIWEKVQTPKGEAREFLYLDGSTVDLLVRSSAA